MSESWKKAQSIVGTSKGRPESDFYPTPISSVSSLLEKEYFIPLVWEPACGDGSISKYLESRWFTIISTDLNSYGYGYSGIDFLETIPNIYPKTIITNPPFSLIYEFIEHAIFDLQSDKVAFFAKLILLEGVKRSKLLEKTPLKKIWVFRKRQTLSRNGVKLKNSGMIAFAWFVWEKGYMGNPQVGWI